MTDNSDSEKLYLAVREKLKNIEGSSSASDWEEMEKLLDSKPKKYGIPYSDISSYLVVGITGIVVAGVLVYMIFNRSPEPEIKKDIPPPAIIKSTAVPVSVRPVKKDSVPTVQSYTNNPLPAIAVVKKDSVFSAQPKTRRMDSLREETGRKDSAGFLRSAMKRKSKKKSADTTNLKPVIPSAADTTKK